LDERQRQQEHYFLGETFKMVTVHFAALVLIGVLSFFVGRTFGRVESVLQFNRRMQDIILALKKVENLAELRGEKLASLSADEIVHRTKRQLELKGDDE
jgi:hypothetical protein